MVYRAALRRARHHARAVRDRAGRVHACASTILPELGPLGTARRCPAAGRRLVRSHVARDQTSREGAGGTARDRSCGELRWLGRAALLSAARPAVAGAELRAVCHYGKVRRRSREARTLARACVAREVFVNSHAFVATRKRAASRLSGAVPRERRRSADGARYR